MIRLLLLLGIIALPCGARAGSDDAVIWNFSGGADGNSPRGDVLSLNGVLYGTTASGGAGENGTVFSITPGAPAGLQTLWRFTGGADGSLPVAGLVADASGTLYGTTSFDGAGGYGTVFALVPPAAGKSTWSLTPLWGFSGGLDGGQPRGTLVADRGGTGILFGTTRMGGLHRLGTVFALSRQDNGSWREEVLWNFSGGTDGAAPLAGLVQDENGVLFGTASIGGAYKRGVVFSLSPPASGRAAWVYQPLWEFTGGMDGANPTAPLTRDAAGRLFGTTKYGGTGNCPQNSWPYYGQPNAATEAAAAAEYIPGAGNQCGVAFMLSPPAAAGGIWNETLLWSFTGALDGANPVGAPFVSSAGKITLSVPIHDAPFPLMVNTVPEWGDVIALTPAASGYTQTTQFQFDGKAHGFYPLGGLVAGAGGMLWGTNAFGGTYWKHVSDYGYGVIYGTQP